MLFKRYAEITVLKKRVTEHSGLNNTRSMALSCPHYTVDCRVSGKVWTRTYTVPYLSMFNRLKVGKSYDALLTFTEIKKIKDKSLAYRGRKKQ